MTNVHRAAAYLLRFDESPPQIQSIDEQRDPSPAIPENEIPQAQDSCEMELASLRRAYEELLENQKNHQQHIENAIEHTRQEWAMREGGRLAKDLADGLDANFKSLRTELARTLSPFVSQQIMEASLHEIIGILRDSISNDENTSIVIEGPKSFIESFSSSFTEGDLSYQTIERDVPDLKITFRTTHIKTKLDEWLTKIQSVMEQC